MTLACRVIRQLRSLQKKNSLPSSYGTLLVQCGVQNNPPLVPILNYLIPVHNLPSYFVNMGLYYRIFCYPSNCSSVSGTFPFFE